MRIGLVGFVLFTAMSTSAQQINPSQVNGTAIVQTPVGPQTITQPSGTTLGVNSLNGVVNAALFAGSDIGAKVNAAILSLSGTCGSVYIPAGSYNYATTINKPRCVKLVGAGAQSTVLNWTPTTGMAVQAFDLLGQFQYPMGYIGDLTLSGTGYTNTAIGLFIGDFTTCGATCGFGDHQSFDHLRIMNFGTGVQWGQNAWSNNFHESLITNNGVGLYFPSGLGNSGEGLDFFGTVIQNNATGMNLVGFSDFYFYGGSCDYNTTTCGNVNAARFYGVHFEQMSGYILTIQGTSQPHVEIIGGWAQLAAMTGTDPAFFYVNGGPNPYLKISGLFVLPNHTVTNLVNWNSSGGAAQLVIEDLPYSPSFAGDVSAYMNVPCNFFGCRIQDNAGAFAYTGATSAVNATGNATYNSVSTAAGASISEVGGWGDLAGNGAGLRLDGGTTPIFISTGSFNAGLDTVNALRFSIGGVIGFTGTKTTGSCTFTIQGGIITNVTGC